MRDWWHNRIVLAAMQSNKPRPTPLLLDNAQNFLRHFFIELRYLGFQIFINIRNRKAVHSECTYANKIFQNLQKVGNQVFIVYIKVHFLFNFYKEGNSD